MMTDDLTQKSYPWAAEIASCAAQLPSRQVREAYLAERRREVAGAVAEGASEGDAVILLASSASQGRVAQLDWRSPRRYEMSYA